MGAKALVSGSAYSLGQKDARGASSGETGSAAAVVVRRARGHLTP